MLSLGLQKPSKKNWEEIIIYTFNIILDRFVMVEILAVNLTHQKGPEETVLYVISKLLLFDEEIQAKGKYHITFDVKGRDYNQGFGKDELLVHIKEEINLNKENFELTDEGLYIFRRAFVINNPCLDEDKGEEEDEVYVEMWIKNVTLGGQSPSTLSNIIHDHFEKKK